jgi:hypothetical protein
MNADAGEFALRVDLQLLEGIGGQQRGMRVKAADHALDGILRSAFWNRPHRHSSSVLFDDIGKDLQPS